MRNFRFVRMQIEQMSLNCTYHITLLINHSGKISENLIDTNNISLKIRRENILLLENQIVII